jgi:RNA polymerase sigma-70 factor (ECF subfamily)
MEDVIEEVFVQLYKSLRHFRGQSEFRTWLYRVTVNVVLSGRAARNGPAFGSEPPEEPSPPSADVVGDENAERHERVRAFESLLSRLTDEKRTVFVLHELEEIALEEIAEIVGAPMDTVRRRLLDAHSELEAMLVGESMPDAMQDESVGRAPWSLIRVRSRETLAPTRWRSRNRS